MIFVIIMQIYAKRFLTITVDHIRSR